MSDDVLFPLLFAAIFAAILYYRYGPMKRDIEANYRPEDEVLNPNRSMRITTFNTFGVDKFGHFRENGNTYVTYQFFTVFFCPIFPIGAYRIEDAEGSKYRVYGSVKSSFKEIFYIYIGYICWILLIILGFIILIGIFGEKDSNNVIPEDSVEAVDSYVPADTAAIEPLVPESDFEVVEEPQTELEF